MGYPRGQRLLPLAIVAFALSACGGGGSAGAPPAMLPTAANPTSSTSTGTGNVELSITLPATSTAAASARKPAFVSSGTAGVQITAYLSTDSAHANPVGSVAAAVGPGAPGCSSSAPVTCQVLISVPPSPAGTSTTFVVTLYNQAPSGGVFPPTALVLGLANVSQTVTANGTNSLPITVAGVPATGIVSILPLIGVRGGIASSYPIIVSAKDAASQPIVGAFATPLQLTTDNPAITSFSINGQPGTMMHASTDSVLVVYNGGPGAANLSLSNTAPAFTATPLSFVPSSGPPSASPGSVLVSIFSLATFTVSESTYTGFGYTESDNCAQYTPPNPTTISQTGLSGGTATFTVDAGFVGGFNTCTATITDTAGQSVSVTVQIQNNT